MKKSSFKRLKYNVDPIYVTEKINTLVRYANGMDLQEFINKFTLIKEILEENKDFISHIQPPILISFMFLPEYDIVVNTLRFIIQHADNLDFNVKDEDSNKTAIMLAIEKRKKKFIVELIPYSNLNIKNKKGQTALMEVLILSHIHDMAVLMIPYSNVSEMDNEGRTALMYAVKINEYDICKQLLETGNSCPNCIDTEGDTALLMAIDKNNVNIVKLLIPYSDMSIIKNNEPILESAVCKYRISDQIIKSLIAADYTTHTILLKVNTLSYLIVNKYNDQVKQLLFSQPNIQPNMFLSLAVCCNNIEMVKHILNISVGSANYQDKDGMTSMMYMVSMKQINMDIFDMLLPNSDLQLQDKWGMTSMMYAAKYNQKEIFKILSTKMNQEGISLTNNWGQTADMIAIGAGSDPEPVFKYLCKSLAKNNYSELDRMAMSVGINIYNSNTKSLKSKKQICEELSNMYQNFTTKHELGGDLFGDLFLSPKELQSFKSMSPQVLNDMFRDISIKIIEKPNYVTTFLLKELLQTRKLNSESVNNLFNTLVTNIKINKIPFINILLDSDMIQYMNLINYLTTHEDEDTLLREKIKYKLQQIPPHYKRSHIQEVINKRIEFKLEIPDDERTILYEPYIISKDQNPESYGSIISYIKNSYVSNKPYNENDPFVYIVFSDKESVMFNWKQTIELMYNYYISINDITIYNMDMSMANFNKIFINMCHYNKLPIEKGDEIKQLVLDNSSFNLYKDEKEYLCTAYSHRSNIFFSLSDIDKYPLIEERFDDMVVFIDYTMPKPVIMSYIWFRSYTEDNDTVIYLEWVRTHPRYYRLGLCELMIKYLTSSYPHINTFELYNAGDMAGCKCYIHAFYKAGFKYFNKKLLDYDFCINSQDVNDITMTFER